MSELVTVVEKVGSEWVATCDHGGEVWEIHRATEYAARRSLLAHLRASHERALSNLVE